MIARVLRPRGTPTQEAPNTEPDAAGGGGEPSAMEQVDMAYEYVKEVDCFDMSEEGNTAWQAAKNR